MKAGLVLSALTLAIASSSVLLTLGLAGLSKPTWLSLICRKVMPVVCAAASPMMPSEVGTPPATVHRTPVPAQVMHSNTLRRLTPSAPRSSSCELIVVSSMQVGPDGMTGGRADLFLILRNDGMTTAPPRPMYGEPGSSPLNH